MPKVLVIGAMHPDERPAGEEPDALGDLLQASPIPGVDYITGNIDAYNSGVRADGLRPRFMDENLVFATPDPNGSVEQRRMHYLAERVFPDYDLIFDVHGRRALGGDYAFGPETMSRTALHALALTGLKRRLLYGRELGHVAGRYSGFLGVDLGPDSSLKAAKLHGLLSRIARGETAELQVGMVYYRAFGAIEMADADRLGLPDSLPSFSVLPDAIADMLGLPRGVVTPACARRPDTKYYGEVWEVADRPADSL